MFASVCKLRVKGVIVPESLNSRSLSFAKPKSKTLTNPSGRIITFSGLMSR
jgi:hypothetical protein